MSETGNSQWHGRIGLIVAGVAAFGSLLAGLAPFISGSSPPAVQQLPPAEGAMPADTGASPDIAAPSSNATLVTGDLAARKEARVDAPAPAAAPEAQVALGQAERASPVDRRLTALENQPFSLCGLNGVTASLWKGPGGAPTGKVTIRVPASQPVIAQLGSSSEVKAGCWLEVVDLNPGPPYKAVFRETSGPQ